MSKKDFSVALKYVEARPRSQRRKGAEARVSGISVVGSGASATDLSLLQANLISVTNNFTALKDLFDSMFEKDSDGNIHAKLSLWSSGGITAGGVGSGGSGGGGGISYNRLDSWADYSTDKAGYVLSALLGKDLDDRVNALANAGYITQSALAPYALRSEIPSLVGYATQGWVGENYLSRSGGKLVYSGAQGLEAERTDGAPTHIMFLGLVNGTSRQLGGFGMNGYNDPVYVNPNGIRHKVLTAENYADYALSKYGGTISDLIVDRNPSVIQYKKNGASVGYLGIASELKPVVYNAEGNTAYMILHAGNYTDYALPLSGGTIYGGIGALKIKRSGIGNSYIEYQNDTETLGYIGFRAKGAPAYMDDATYIQYDLLHLYNYRDYVVAINGNSTINGSITATSFIGNLAGQATGASLLRKTTSATSWCVANGNSLDIHNSHPTKRFWFGWDIPEGSPYATNEWHFGASDGTGKDSGTVYAASFIGNLTGTADKSKVLGDYYGERVTSANLDFTDSAVRKIIATSSMTTAKPPADGSILHFAWDNTGGWNHQLFIACGGNVGPDKRMAWRAQHYGSWSEWKSIAFIDSNVASATKLATPRLIWGQSFDGTQDITGALTSSSIIKASSFFSTSISIECDANGVVDPITYGGEINRFSSNLYLQNRGGNIYLSHASGTTYIRGKLNGVGATFTDTLTVPSITIGGVTITYDSANEALCINGNMYALGGITAGGAGISAYSSLEARVARLEQQLNIS